MSAARTTARPSPAPAVAGGGEAPPAVALAPAVPEFESLFTEMAPYVMRVVRRMGVASADIDDVVQEVFLAVYRGLPTFAERSTLRTWVYGICIRVCSNHRDRAYRRRERLVLEAERLQDRRDPEQHVAQQRALAELDRTLAALPTVQRAVFVLFEIEGLDMREVAEALGCSKFTAYARLYAARTRVSTALRPHRSGDEP